MSSHRRAVRASQNNVSKARELHWKKDEPDGNKENVRYIEFSWKNADLPHRIGPKWHAEVQARVSPVANKEAKGCAASW